MSETPADLSPAQREIMDVIWEREELSASELRLILAETREIARNTVRTMLERMEAKGWLKHRVDGRTYLYSAARPRDVTIGEKVRQVVDTVCDGSPEKLVTALLDHRGLSRGELDRIRTMLDEARARAKKKPSQRKGGK